MTQVDIEFLAWLELCLFPESVEQELVRVGVPLGEAILIGRSDAVRLHHSVVRLYRDYGRDSAWFMPWIEERRADYDAIQRSHQ